ncbi:MAG: Glu-tRNA(Gln) amidotransferase subunit GatE [Candidatus Aenigmarchaeota archaeon]|nr:Glu-tRNA(Gln) amidotransferase subunit GatE [Candidatus Aenigmarchaeota archaeon]
MDFSKLGLKCGIEIHQQLDTDHKLFCGCRNSLSDQEFSVTINRKLRPVAGEMGDIDPAALHEKMRNLSFVYNAYPMETCLVESDSEPPHELNRDALETSLTIGMLTNCMIPDEIHVMRKTVIDGSNTSGFQRTAIVGLDGKIKTTFGDVGITNVCLEEEACQILGSEEGRIFYGLDRLGIPLVEIGTAPDIRDPEQAREVAEKLGMIVRSTERVKRGLGTIRQDINVSIRGGARIEIKGSQDLRLIPKLVENEISRQESLIKIAEELKKKVFGKAVPQMVHVSHIFKNAQCNITKNSNTYAILIPCLRGFLKRNITPTRTLGNEIANYARVKTGIKGFIHNDEDLSKYRLIDEFNNLEIQMEAKANDTVIIAVGEKNLVQSAMNAITERVNMLTGGVPEETRKALDSGDTEYMRPLPGASRLYPETDIPPISLGREYLKKIRSGLPELIEVRKKKETKEMKKHDISDEMIAQIVNSGKKKIFDELVRMGFDPSIASTILTSTLRSLERKEGVDISRLELAHFERVLEALENGKITKEAIPGVLKMFAENPKEELDKAIKKTGVKSLADKELVEIIKKTFEENKNLFGEPRGEKVILGLVMQKVRGKADAKKVIQLVGEEFSKMK